MTPAQLKKLDEALGAYLEEMVVGMGRLERRRAMEAYVTGLLLDGERKSIEPMAARLRTAWPTRLLSITPARYTGDDACSPRPPPGLPHGSSSPSSDSLSSRTSLSDSLTGLPCTLNCWVRTVSLTLAERAALAG